MEREKKKKKRGKIKLSAVERRNFLKFLMKLKYFQLLLAALAQTLSLSLSVHFIHTIPKVN